MPHVQGRMDGTSEQQYIWRIDALREALDIVKNTILEGPVAACVCNALAVDDENMWITGNTPQHKFDCAVNKSPLPDLQPGACDCGADPGRSVPT